MTNSEIEEYLVGLDHEVLRFKEDLFRISWHMRGGVNVNDLLHTYSQEDIDIMNVIINEHIELTKDTRMAII